MAHADHEDDDPASKGDFDADVAEQEDGAQPGSAGPGSREEGLLEAVARPARVPRY